MVWYGMVWYVCMYVSDITLKMRYTAIQKLYIYNVFMYVCMYCMYSISLICIVNVYYEYPG